MPMQRGSRPAGLLADMAGSVDISRPPAVVVGYPLQSSGSARILRRLSMSRYFRGCRNEFD
ncbi:protein of unknown function [Pseudomonas mediterranea]